MKKERRDIEFCLIVTGSYLTEEEAEHALRDPFIEDLVERTGKFRIHNLGEMEIAPGVVLASLSVRMIDEGEFEIYGNDFKRPLTRKRAEQVAEAIRQYDMFDEINVIERDDVAEMDE